MLLEIPRCNDAQQRQPNREAKDCSAHPGLRTRASLLLLLCLLAGLPPLSAALSKDKVVVCASSVSRIGEASRQQVLCGLQAALNGGPFRWPFVGTLHLCLPQTLFRDEP